MFNFDPKRVARGKRGAGRFDFKHNTESDIDLIDCEMEPESVMTDDMLDSRPRVGSGSVSESRSYLRAIEAIEHAKSARSMGDALRGLLRGRGDVSGFDDDELDLERTREAARTLADLFTKYPAIESNIVIGETGPESVAEAHGYRRTKEREYFRKDMVINREKMVGAYTMNESYQKSKASGWFHSTTDDVTPLQYVVTHEFGHLIDYTSECSVSPHKVRNAYIDEQGFKSAYTQEAEDHIKANMSRYANTNRQELLAEAFADVEMNGSKAFGFSKALYNEMMGALK